jgi:nickel-dependent lactate racemase
MSNEVNLAYGRTGKIIRVPEGTPVIRTQPTSGLLDETAAIRDALCNPIKTEPLKEKIHPGDRVVITHSDLTRATPNDRILPVIITELLSAGIIREDIIILNALGTHRKQTLDELRQMLGDEIVNQYRCIQHDAFDDSNLVSIGTTSFGNPIRVNRLLVECNARIYTGFIEPHFFAGFSGGPKCVLPALAGAESVLSNHSQQMIAHPNATWGVTKGNPIWEEMLEVALLTEPTFLVNVTLNSSKQISGIFAGDLLSAHSAGCEFTRKSAMAPVEKLYDVVITTNSGYPLDQNLYQCIKGLSAASRITRPDGAILLAAACEDGLPNHGSYARLLEEGGSPDGILEMISQHGFSMPDQWQVQIQALIQRKVDAYVFSDGLTTDQVRKALFNPVEDIQQSISSLVTKYGENLCVMPEGPLTIPYVKS